MVRTEEKTYQVRLTKQAQKSISYVVGYIAYVMREPQNAVRVGDKLFQTIDRIERNPFIFRECEEIPTKNKIYRKAVCMSWLIIYRINQTEVVNTGYHTRKSSPS